MALAPRRMPNCNIPKTPEKGLDNKRIEQLEDRVISRDRKIN